ncbi:hypothetical protein [Frankia sp. R82]|uniref:hypothetical protein n=1 Tax=Frankia sp. R82 TaxID=2950553 RepID=UPI002043BF39|nr:hypothetical protein [Frankia sp. R82]MCM3883993.1 hypothetical protein [Frankia sp. R82]
MTITRTSRTSAAGTSSGPRPTGARRARAGGVGGSGAGRAQRPPADRIDGVEAARRRAQLRAFVRAAHHDLADNPQAQAEELRALRTETTEDLDHPVSGPRPASAQAESSWLGPAVGRSSAARSSAARSSKERAAGSRVRWSVRRRRWSMRRHPRGDHRQW